MPENVGYTIQVPIRTVDAEDVKNAFAKMYNYQEKVDLGLGVLENNPVSKEKFVETCCAQFLFNIYKNYMVQKAETDAKNIAEAESSQRSQDVVAWFDNLRMQSLPQNPYTNHPLVEDVLTSCNSNQVKTISLSGTDPDNLPLTFEIVGEINSGSAVISQEELTFTPDISFGGNVYINYRASNGTKVSNQGQITVQVTSVKPTSSNQNVSTQMNTPINITLSGSDSLGNDITFTLGSATSGTVSILDNVVTYTPETDFLGDASFGFTVNNGVMNSDEYYVYVSVV